MVHVLFIVPDGLICMILKDFSVIVIEVLLYTASGLIVSILIFVFSIIHSTQNYLIILMFNMVDD